MSELPLISERAWLDLRLERDLRALRAAYEMSAEEFKGLWVSDDLVEALLRTDAGRQSRDAAELRPCPRSEPLAAAADRFGLNEVEYALLTVALAAEVDGKYEPIFAYLNGAASRRWPTLGLARRLFGLESVASLSPNNRLMTTGLLSMVEVDGTRPEVAREFRAGRALTQFVQGLDPLLPADTVWLSPVNGDPGPLKPFSETARHFANPVLLTGQGDCGRIGALRALAGKRDRRLLHARLAFADSAASNVLTELDLIARLSAALVVIDGTEPQGPDAIATMTRMAGRLARMTSPTFVMAEPGSLLWQLSPHSRTAQVHFSEPRPRDRERIWRRAIANHVFEVEPDTPDQLALRFRLGPDQIAEAAAAAGLLLRSDRPDITTDREALFAAAREISGHELARLARRIPSTHRLADLVLPPVTLERVKAVVNAVEHYDLVHSEWGLTADGRATGGLATLFQGPSGTGKTMTASAIAAEAGLDLYRINLSSVVSKYIGETEKNLETIFCAARRASAVLMFDEADAIFGKRAEVKDAHDRYANIETAYLLQRIEEHDGPVILATNLAKNIDQAFSRRLHYIVEFPRPDADNRKRLWQRMLAPPVPVGDDVDCAVLARDFELTGGDIRKAVLEAAYMSAGDGGVVSMRHLTASAVREARRQGRLFSAEGSHAIQEVA
ncbi:ATP-binding protein [Bradyrhizobium niftali]|nr:ATP-binding protein [Bradyrhizobium niftali]